MEVDTAAVGGGGVEDMHMGLPVHSPGPLPWSQVSEPAVDTGINSNGQSLSWIPNFSEDDFTSHRNVFVGIHVPYSAHRHHRKGRGRRHRHKDKAGSGDHTPPEQSIPAVGEPPKTPMDPCDRVKFILGVEEEDGTANGTTPHQVFTELDELCMHHGQPVWKETARWLKFEEDVEEGGDKWSKPHVATLSLHSLFELRSNLTRGTVMLDVDASNLAHIADLVLDNLVVTGQLEEENREKVREALLIRHRHQNNDMDILRHIRSFADFRKGSHLKKPDGSEDSTSLHHEPEVPPTLGARSSSVSNNLGPRFPWLSSSTKGSPHSSRQDISPAEASEEHYHHKHHANQRFLRKIPPGAEASNVLVGEVDFLTRPMIAFVRLSQSAWLGDITEVPIPTRFLFFLLGPLGNSARFHEVGRAISTLMADEVFRDVAYKGRNREDLIAGVDEFLDKVTVLPPGEWDPNIRIEPPPSIPSQAARKSSIVPPNGGSQQPSRRGSIQGGAGGGAGDGAPPPPNGGSEGEREDDNPKVPPVQNKDNGVQCTRRPFGGLIGDIKRRYRRYLSDYLDAFYPVSAISPTLASVIFIYFASVAPAITFGALLGQKTDNLLGPMEMLLSCSIGNFIFSIFAGQPLIILGGTGPLLVFEDILYQFTQSSAIPYLQFRFWIGMWVAFLLVIFVATDLSYIIRLFTRFTQESFSVLISLIFIFEAFKSVWNIHVTTAYHPWLLYPTITRGCRCYTDVVSANDTNGTNTTRIFHNLVDLLGPHNNASGVYPTCSEINPEFMSDGQCPEQYEHDVFFWSVILFFGTFLTIRLVKSIKESPFLMTWLRRIIGDFSVLISVVIWMVANIIAKVNTSTLIIPNVVQDGFTPTACSGMGSDCNIRGWIVNPMRSLAGVELPVWGVFAAIIPALLAVVLIFMDQQITAVIVNRKDFKLQKGHGYHLDLLIVAILIVFFSILGIPWIVGATVRSLIHVQSLFRYSPFTAPGEVAKVEGVREQRVTNMAVAALLGISIIAGPLLRYIPLPVLYGLFLFMGISSLSGVQFVDRFLLMFIPDKYKPDHEYVRHVPNRWMHAFTLTQVVCIIVLAVIKETEASIVFPIAVGFILVPVRWVIGFIFPKKDLRYLDTALPKWMYSRPSPCCRKQKTKELCHGLEMGNLMVYEEEPYQRPTTALSINSNGGATITDGSAQAPSATPECSVPTINISSEVNRCNLYRHLDRVCSRTQPACKHLLEGIAEAPESPDTKKPPQIIIDGNHNSSSSNVQPRSPESLC